ELMARVAAGHVEFFEEYERSIQKPYNADLYAEVSALIDPVLNEKILAPAQEYLELNEQLLTENSAATHAMAGWLQASLILVGICGAGGGLLVGLAMAWQYGRRMVQVHVRLRDTASQLNEVVGPITLTAGQGLRDLDFDLQKLGEPVRKIIK